MQKQPSYIAVFFLTWMVTPGAVWADKSPVPVAPGGPSGQTAVSRACPTFHWSVSMERSIAGYELAIYRVGGDKEEGLVPTAEPVLHHRLPAGVGGWTLPPDRCLAPGGRYAWSVRAVGEGVEGSWSEPALFEISAVPSLAEVEEALEVLRRFERGNERSRAEPGEAEAVVAPTVSASGAYGPSAALETAQVGTNAAPSASTSPSLSVDGQIHLDSAGDVFREGVPFLWTDGLANAAAGSVALGLRALHSVTSGANNTAVGHTALAVNTTGGANSAFGEDALLSNTTGSNNSAFGEDALRSNVTGSENTAVGQDALRSSTTGSANTAVGEDALLANTAGSNNIAVGRLAGASLAVAASNNILIGHNGSGVDVGTPEIRIGVHGLQDETRIAGIVNSSLPSGTPVVVESDGRLGISASSLRFKEDVRDMGEVSDKLSKLRPVRFRFKAEDADSGERPLEYGLIAEEVAEVLPELVPLDAEGRPYAVRYDLLSSLLLSELQRQRQEYDRIELENRENRRIDLAQARLLAAQRRDIEALERKLAAAERASKGRGARKR